jgi:tetratricopeptide (TPR) repeat protein
VAVPQSASRLSRLRLLPWYSIRFRYLALWVARHSRSLLPLFIAFCVACALAFAPAARHSLMHWLGNLSWSSVGKTAAALALLWLLGWGLKVRQRIFVASFEDFTGDASLKEFVSGLPRLLLNELGVIRQLHADVNEAGAAGVNEAGAADVNEAGAAGVTSKEETEATIRVQDVGETLQKAVTSESKVKLWGIEIPVGALLSLFGRFAQGPQLSGSIYSQNGEITLIARLEGAGYSGTDWRVVSSDPDMSGSTESPLRLSQMLEQLAYRIFTDLVPTGARRWRAVYAFSQGLKNLRITTRTANDKFWNLRQAEARFIEALAEDSKFSPCFYNLGVVYTQLSQPDSACAAYSKAIEQDPLFAPSYYALALSRWNQANKKQGVDAALLNDCLRFCGQAILLDQNYARAWNLQGLAYRKLNSDARDELKQSVRSRARAAALSWRAYCGVNGRAADPSAIEIPFNCLRNLAVGHGVMQTRQAPALYRQALFLKPLDADLHYEFGRALHASGQYKKAASEFQAAAQIDGKPLYWTWLAKAQLDARVALPLVKDSLWKALRGPEVDAAARAELTASFGWNADLAPFIADADEARKIAFEIKLQDAEETDLQPYLIRLEGLLPALPPGQARDNWRLNQVLDALQNRSADPEKQNKIRTIAEAFVLDKGIYGSVALGFRDRGREGDLITALFHAEYAVTLNPMRYWERSVLGDIYWALGDYDRAQTEYNTGLDISPAESDILSGVANTYWFRGVDIFNLDQRRRMFSRVIDGYGRVLRITENQILGQDATDMGKRKLNDRGRSHFWLGRFHHELLNYDGAISELRKAKGLGFKPFESALHLASSYIEAKAFDQAESTLISGIGDLLKFLRALKLKERRPQLEKPADKPGEDMQISELLVWSYLLRAQAATDRRGNLAKAARMAKRASARMKRIAAPKRQAPEALYHQILGLLALKTEKWPEAIRQLECSVSLAFESRSYLSLAEAHLALAQNSADQWKQEIKTARDCCDLATAANLRRGRLDQINALRAQLDAFEQDKKPAAKPASA